MTPSHLIPSAKPSQNPLTSTLELHLFNTFPHLFDSATYEGIETYQDSTRHVVHFRWSSPEQRYHYVIIAWIGADYYEVNAPDLSRQTNRVKKEMQINSKNMSCVKVVFRFPPKDEVVRKSWKLYSRAETIVKPALSLEDAPPSADQPQGSSGNENIPEGDYNDDAAEWNGVWLKLANLVCGK